MYSDRLKELRQVLELSQKQFAEKINLSQTHLASLESGKRTLTERVSKDICRIYHINEDWLVNGNPPMYIERLNALAVDEDIKQLAVKYSSLNDKDKALVQGIVDLFFEKSKL